MKTKTLDLFVTDTDYDKEQIAIGRVKTLEAGLIVQAEGAGVIPALKDAANSWRTQVIVRFVCATVITDFITVREVGTNTFTVENAVSLPQETGTWQCILVRPWRERPLQLTTRFQHVVAVEVLAYALVGLSSLTLWEMTETNSTPPSIDYIGLEIKELPGRAMSTNRFMQNMLAILPTHASAYHPSSWTEAKDAMIFVPHCMMKTEYEQPIITVNTITPKLVDRRGNSVGATRFHLWLRLTVLDQ